MSRSTRRRDRGFTLVEMLVVVLIVGLLASIAIPTFVGARNHAYNADAIARLRNAVLASESFYSENEHYGVAGNRLDLNSEETTVAIPPNITYSVGRGTQHTAAAAYGVNPSGIFNTDNPGLGSPVNSNQKVAICVASRGDTLYCSYIDKTIGFRVWGQFRDSRSSPTRTLQSYSGIAGAGAATDLMVPGTPSVVAPTTYNAFWKTTITP
jgi:prepilin-type N-terminal cleavage/methylation domain-containing protein